MNRFLRISTLLGILCISVCCGGDSTETPDPTPDPPAPPVIGNEISFPGDVPPTPVFTCEGGELPLAFTAGGAWTAEVSDPVRAAKEWLSVTPASGASGAATITLAALPNDTDENRTGILTLRSGKAVCELTVTQTYEGALVVAPASITVDNAGGEIPIEVVHNVDFDIEIDGDWITDITTRALTTETLLFRIAENPGYDNRAGTITFTSKDKTLTQEVKIYQAQTDALVVSPTDNVFDDKGRTFEIEVRANVDFTVENPDVLWLEPVETRGLKTHTLKYRLAENTTYDSRSAQIRIVDAARNLSQTVTVTQLQKDALVVAKSSYTLPQEGGEITVELSRNVDFDIEIGQPWITQVTTRGLTTEHLVFRIVENPDTENREGVIVFVSKDREIRQEVQIEQEGLNAVEEAKVRAYLVKLYHDTDGPHWRNRTNWCSDKPINEWWGVTYEDGKLSLDLMSEWNGSNNTIILNNLKGEADLSGCEALVRFDCWGSSGLTSLDVSGCTALEYLNCAKSDLSNLNVFGCTALNELICSDNGLTNLDISTNRMLKKLNCDENKLNDLDVSGFKELEFLLCGENRTMTTLDASGCEKLELLNCCYDQELSRLDISGCVKLRDLLFKVTKVTELDLTACVNLETISCYGSNLYNLDISGLKKIRSVDCNTNRHLTRLNASGCTALTYLNCDCGNYYVPAIRGKLISLDVSGCSALTSLSCEGNYLESLDISDCTALIQLNCSTNQLKYLHVSNCTALTHLWCTHNRLENLNVSNCTALTILDCEDNLLTSLNVTNCAAMTYLACRDNRRLCQVITDWYKQLASFFHDWRYEYFRNANGTWLYTDHGFGWWYPGEPESGINRS